MFITELRKSKRGRIRMLRIHFLNVGKGDCSVVDFASGHLSVIDIDDSRSLSASEKLAMALDRKASLTNPVEYITTVFSDREIFRFILTHPDMDHMSGLKQLFDRKNVWNFWDTANERPNPGNWGQGPYSEDDWDFYQRLRQEEVGNITYIRSLRDAQSRCCWVQDGIRILSPTLYLVDEANENDNWDDLSYVLMIEYGGRKVLLGGDATKKAWEDMINFYGDYLESDVFFAPNHGSPNHISEEILNVINPDLVVVSVAEGVEYARDLYANYGGVLSTKYYGNIWLEVEADGKVIFRTQFRDYSSSWYILKRAFY